MLSTAIVLCLMKLQFKETEMSPTEWKRLTQWNHPTSEWNLQNCLKFPEDFGPLVRNQQLSLCLTIQPESIEIWFRVHIIQLYIFLHYYYTLNQCGWGLVLIQCKDSKAFLDWTNGESNNFEVSFGQEKKTCHRWLFIPGKGLKATVKACHWQRNWLQGYAGYMRGTEKKRIHREKMALSHFCTVSLSSCQSWNWY